MNALAKAAPDASSIERVMIQGDLAQLNPEQRLGYYKNVCESLGLNPLTKPFDYITLNGKMVLYAKRDCTDQLRKLYKVSLTIVGRELVEDIYVVTAHATMPDGRTDESTGAVSIGGLKGENRANALMKAETKAKRRATLSIVGLGFLDETEVDSIAGAEKPTGKKADPMSSVKARLGIAKKAEAPQAANAGDVADRLFEELKALPADRAAVTAWWKERKGDVSLLDDQARLDLVAAIEAKLGDEEEGA